MKMKYFDQLQWASPPRLEAVDQSLSRCSSSVSREQEVTRALRYVEHHLDLHYVHIPALQRSALWRLSGLHWMQLSEGERQGGGDHQVQLGGGDPGQARSSEEEALITFKGNSRQEPGLVTMKLHQKIHTYTCFNLPVKVYFWGLEIFILILILPMKSYGQTLKILFLKNYFGVRQ